MDAGEQFRCGDACQSNWLGALILEQGCLASEALHPDKDARVNQLGHGASFARGWSDCAHSRSSANASSIGSVSWSAFTSPESVMLTGWAHAGPRAAMASPLR